MKITQKMSLLYTHLQIYTKIEPKKCITKMSLVKFLLILCSYVLLFLSSTYLSLPRMFQYAVYPHLQNMINTWYN